MTLNIVEKEKTNFEIEIKLLLIFVKKISTVEYHSFSEILISLSLGGSYFFFVLFACVGCSLGARANSDRF